MTSKSRQAKGDTYAKALDAARLRGEWEGAQASGTGKDVAWSELIRKYMKHNPNEQLTPTVANVEQQLRTALAAFYKANDYTDASHLSDAAYFKRRAGNTLFPPVLPLNRSGQGWSGEGVGDVIKQLDELHRSAREPTAKQSIAALQAYALFVTGQDENAIELLHEVRFLEDVDRQTLRSGNVDGEYTIALIMMGFTVYGMANERLFEKRKDEGYVPFAFAGYASAIDLHEGFRGGVAAKALRGLPPDEIERWGELALYRNALFGVRNASTPALGLNALRAYQGNAGRWTVNFRVAQRLVIFRTYLAVLNMTIEQGGYKPPPAGVSISNDDCRSAAYQSSVMAVAASRVEVRDFESERQTRLERDNKLASVNNVFGGGGAGAKPVDAIGPNAPRTTSKRRPVASRALAPSSPWWTNEFLTAQKTAAECLARTSQFPRAGKVNKAALDLADELIKGWQINGERGGYDADELVDVLYTLSRFTFHSQRISRLLFTILVAAENFAEAEKALDMYIQIVEKSREGDAAESAGLTEEAKRREAGKEGPNKETDKEANGEEDEDKKIALLSDEAKESAKEVHIDADPDQLFINTLLHGSHVLVRYLGNAKKANDLARKATTMYEKNGDLGKDELLLARIKRVSGSARAAHSRSLLEPSQRPALQNEALSLLKQSVTYDDQSSETYYQLAVLQAELHDVSAAVRSARRAVELEPAHVDYWHLLALLVSAQKDFRGALRVAEEGLAEAEDDDEVAQQQPASRAPAASNGVANGNAAAGGALQKLSGSAAAITSGGKRTTLLSVDYPPSPRERVEGVLRLMITHNALEELVEGAQAAIEAQREIFESFHRRFATHNHGQRQMAPFSHATAGANGRADDSLDGVNGKGGAGQSNGSRFSTMLGGPGQSHNRFHSLTGLGHSGAGHHLWNSLSGGQRSDGGNAAAATLTVGGATIPAGAREGDEELPTTSAEVRSARHLKQETAVLCALWLMAAATFRRNGNALDCRVAIQEAERVDPGNGDVWLQLALWSEKQPTSNAAVEESPNGFAIQSLYKALACSSEHVGAAVHLARLFLANPLNPHIQDSQRPEKPLLKDVASPLPQTTENFHASALAGDLLSRTQSRKISASPATAEDSPASHDRDEGDQDAQRERKRLATISMAEGLLVSLTQGQGWSTPEAWLFLAKVMQQTDRAQRQRECLEYALQLERSKPIRPILVALPTGC